MIAPHVRHFVVLQVAERAYPISSRWLLAILAQTLVSWGIVSRVRCTIHSREILP